MAGVTLQLVHTVRRCLKCVATGSGGVAVDVLVARGVDDRDVEENKALRAMNPDIGLPGASS